MQESNLMVGKEQSPVKTANALVAVHTLLKPYKYFQNPGSEKETAPPELEAIARARACSSPGRHHRLPQRLADQEALGLHYLARPPLRLLSECGRLHRTHLRQGKGLVPRGHWTGLSPESAAKKRSQTPPGTT